jgi:hypothetical protein
VDLGRYLATDGEMGECPDWYAHIQIARYLRVGPDELMHMSIYWKSKAMKAMDAESRARKILERIEENKRGNM